MLIVDGGDGIILLLQRVLSVGGLDSGYCGVIFQVVLLSFVFLTVFHLYFPKLIIRISLNLFSVYLEFII